MRTTESLLFLLLLLCATVTLGCSIEGESTGPQRVFVADVGTRVKLIGRLGEPLGTVVNIKGRWERFNFKDSGALRLKVTSVNSKELDQPVLFHINLVETAQNKDGMFPQLTQLSGNSLEMVEWNVRAIETGHYELGNTTGMAMGLPAVGLPDYFEDFTSRLICIIESAERLP